MDLCEVVILEVCVELFKKVIKGDHRLIAEIRKGERLGVVVHDGTPVGEAVSQRAALARRGLCAAGWAKTCR